jgi:hypothetical protein
MFRSDVEVKATQPVVQNEDFRGGKFPTDRLVRQNARRVRLLMKI